MIGVQQTARRSPRIRQDLRERTDVMTKTAVSNLLMKISD